MQDYEDVLDKIIEEPYEIGESPLGFWTIVTSAGLIGTWALVCFLNGIFSSENIVRDLIFGLLGV